MAKQSGMGDNCYVGGYNLSGDIGSLSKISGSVKPLVVTGIDKSAFERIGGLRDGDLSFTAFFNPAAGQEHPVLSALPTADVIVSYFHGTTLGNPCASMVGKQIGYDGTRGNDGSLTFNIDAQANGFGLEWGLEATAGIRTDTTATNGASLDYGSVSTTFGGQAYLQVFAFTGTSVTVKLQDSADNASFADIAGAGFTAATAITSQRIAFSGTVRRYVRAITTGTFSNAQFAVQFTRNETSVVF